MATKIKIRRGLEADLPALDVGEMGFTTDTKKLYIGSATGNVLLNAGGSELALPQLYNLWEKSASDNPYRKNFVYTDPLSSTLQNLISSGDLDLQVWVYKETKRGITATEANGGYPVGGSINRPIQKIVHPEDRIAPSLLTGRTRPIGSGLGVAVSLSGENQFGTILGNGSFWTSTATATNYVKTTASHYNGWVRTELPVVVGDLKADGRLKVDVSKFVTSYLANMTYIIVGTTTYLHIKKNTISEDSQIVIFDNSQFAAGNTANSVGNPVYLYLQGMKSANKGIGVSYNAGGTQYNINTINGHTGTFLNRPHLTLPCFYLRLVGSIDGTNLIYGPMLKVYFPVYYSAGLLLGYLSHKPHATLLDVPLGS